MKASVTILYLVLATALEAGPRTSANYSTPAETADGGGARATSTAYANDGSVGDVVGVSTVASPAITAKQGYLGQIFEVTGIELAASPATVNEGLTRQITASQVLDDATTITIASGVTWSVVSGPLVGIDSNGLVTAAKLHVDTGAVVQGVFQTYSDTLNLTVLNTATDVLSLGATLFTVNEESGMVSIEVVRTGSTDGAVTINLSTSAVGGTATVGGDYTAITNQAVPFAHGESSKLVPVTILPGNAVNEANETFTVNLSTPGPGATLGTPATATVRIIDPGDVTIPGVPTIATPAISPALGLVTGATTLVTGAATDNKGVGTVKVKLNTGLFVDAAISLTGGGTGVNYTLPVTPVAGTNTITVQSFDTRGNPSSLVSRTFNVLRPLVVNANALLGSVTAGFSPTSFREVGKSLTITATPKPPTTTPAFGGALFSGWTLGGQDVAQGNAAFTPQRLGMAASALKKQTITFAFREGLTLTANFVATPFAPLAGTYNGLIRPSATLPDRAPAGAGAEDGTVRGNGTEGGFTATVTNTGAFSGKLTIDGLVLNVAGSFDQNGDARFGTARTMTQTVARTGKPSLTVALHLNTAENQTDITVDDKITGTVTATEFKQSVVAAVSNVDSDRAFYNGTTVLAPAAYLGVAGANGVFNVILPAKDLASQPAGFTKKDYPQGCGIATVTVTKAGVVTVVGTLADNTAVSASSTLSEIGAGHASRFPLFASLYTAKGFLSGFVTLDSVQADSDMAAVNVQWLRPFNSASHYYPYGWPEVIKVDLLGAKYVAGTTQSSLKAVNGANLQAADADGNAVLTLSDGQLTEVLNKTVNVSTADAVTKAPDPLDPTFSLMLTRASGAISGSFTHTSDSVATFKGTIYQKGADAGAHGFFLTKQPVPIDYTGESGGVTLIGQP